MFLHTNTYRKRKLLKIHPRGQRKQSYRKTIGHVIMADDRSSFVQGLYRIRISIITFVLFSVKTQLTFQNTNIWTGSDNHYITLHTTLFEHGNHKPVLLGPPFIKAAFSKPRLALFSS